MIAMVLVINIPDVIMVNKPNDEMFLQLGEALSTEVQVENRRDE